MQIQRDKVRQFAQDKLGYRPNYIKQQDYNPDNKITVTVQGQENCKEQTFSRIGTSNAQIEGQHQTLAVGGVRGPGSYRLSQADESQIFDGDYSSLGRESHGLTKGLQSRSPYAISNGDQNNLYS